MPTQRSHIYLMTIQKSSWFIYSCLFKSMHLHIQIFFLWSIVAVKMFLARSWLQCTFRYFVHVEICNVQQCNLENVQCHLFTTEYIHHYCIITFLPTVNLLVPKTLKLWKVTEPKKVCIKLSPFMGEFVNIKDRLLPLYIQYECEHVQYLGLEYICSNLTL